MDLLIRCIIQVALFSCFLNKDGVEGMRKLSKDEDLEFEKQLKLINKSPIKSFQTKDGYIYDCIDFYKQPAFDHPLLKNHTFHHQMKPSSMPKMARKNDDIANLKDEREAELTSVSCPVGTVPIRRVTKDDLLRFKLLSERHNSNYSILTAENPGTHYALVKTRNDPTKKYNGGGTFMSVYNPSVLDSQRSSVRMKVKNGRDSIQVGWTVNPALYGDHNTHLYIYTETSQSRCFNTQCPGFITVNTEIPIDARIKPVSKWGGAQYTFKYMIYRDTINGNWWLALGKDLTPVGFWPKRIFTDLADMATSLDWGGEVFSPPNVSSPPMGSGHLIKSGFHYRNYNAYCASITTINESDQIVDAANTLEDADVFSTYEVAFVQTGSDYFRRIALSGGPGGITGN